MKPPVTISKEKPKIPALDYEFLRQEGLKYIEALASDIWTDYNSHDPGITILEMLCYAITDLGLRTNFQSKIFWHQRKITVKKCMIIFLQLHRF